MKMVKYYIAGALIAFALLLMTPSFILQILLGWTSFSLAAVSSAYIFNYPSLFRKRDDGSIPFYIRWIFVPFLFGSWLYNEYARRTDKVPPLQKVKDNLYLACRMSSQHVDLLNKNDISAILDVTAEFDGLDYTALREDYQYLNIPVLDHTSPTSEQLIHAINWIDQQIAADRNVVVHCALGRGRSVLVVAAYLLAKDSSLTVEQAMQSINTIRETARLNKKQMSALEKVKKGGLLSLQKNLVLIANPVAGGGKWSQNKSQILARLNEKFNVTVEETTPEKDGKVLAKKAKDEGADIVVACGGDGTLAEVASVLVDTPLTMGFIPLGTANALSQVLHGYMSKVMPIDIACDIIIEGRTLSIDTARCNDNIMLLVAAVGFEEQMISSADRDEKNEGGQFAYIKGLWSAISNNENMSFRIQTDDNDEETLTTPSFVVANAAPMSTALAQGDEPPDITDGKLDLTWLLPQTTADKQLLSLAELILSPSDHKRHSENIRHAQAKTVTLTFDSTMSYAVDGEIYQADSLSITTVPKSLTVLTNIEKEE
ncbi:diacylglycerol kinase family protein [Alteromonas sp. BMJM2]|uniref:diacylglycerol kinase family protein n=1 Tax=Alteromonas sp. BMJM2 TaxID=2954241 RepID=UPI0022B59B26|nr:diacylglycerol kinase family protein [Alteromonas sp. BMJM2]